MPKPVDTAFKAVCEATRNSQFGKDTFIDGRTYLQDSAIRTIYRAYPVCDVVETTFNNDVLYYYVRTDCHRLLCFTILYNGLFTLRTVPVFGGNNTPFHKPIVVLKSNQISCL
jgi:hypothetical protein